MMMKKKEINLLPTSDFEKSLLGKTLTWFFTVGKYVCLAIEFIVIIAWLYRFKLDRDLTNVNETIKGNQTAITAFGDLETKFRFLKERINVTGSIDNIQMHSTDLVGLISVVMTKDIYLTDLSLDKNIIDINGIALSDASLAAFLSSLGKIERFTEIDLSHLTSSSSRNSEISFRLAVRMKQPVI